MNKKTKKKEGVPVRETKPLPKEQVPTMLGPGVTKRPKRDPAAPPPHDAELGFTPSEQVFRRR
jgi:hypothetical protein